jgi:hypothetical protein
MSASAEDPVDPGSTSDGPKENARPEEIAAHHPPAEGTPVGERPPANLPKAGQLAKPNPILTNPNLESAQASARLEAQQLSWPPWQQQPRPFAGDTTTAGAHSAAPSADTWAQPDDHSKQGRYVTGLIVIATAAVAGTVSYLWSSHQGSNSRDPADLVSSAAPSTPPDPARQPGARAVAESPSLPPESARRLVFSPSEEARLRERAQQLTVKAARLWQVDAPARLIVSATDAPADVDVVIIGLATGSVLSLGKPVGPNQWRLSAKDLNSVMILPPRGFVGVMDLILELRLTNDNIVDRKGLLLEWSHNSALATGVFPPRQIEAAEIELMVKSGLEFMGNGNIAAARMMFQPAAEAGDAVAAFALAETYDPSVLKKLGIKGGIAPDVALANTWYEKARALGSTLARERLEALARVRE